MNTKNKKAAQEAARWLRIGTLTFTTLGPVINELLVRLRDRNEEVQQTVETKTTIAEPQEKLLVVGAALNELLAELKNNPYGQDLLERGEEVASDLIERGSRLSQLVAERGSRFTRNVARRGSEFTQDLAERSERATKELTHRSRELVERNDPAFLAAGFGVGLLATAVTVYLLVRKRLQVSSIDEASHIELSANGHINTHVIEANFKQATEPAVQPQPTSEGAKAVAEPVETTSTQIPTDAVLVGVVDTRRYYPVETPLDQLNTSGEGALNVIYFASEEEAKAQGFTAAE